MDDLVRLIFYIWAGVALLYFIYACIAQVYEQIKKDRNWDKILDKWLRDEEPLYRNRVEYPPDWTFRKIHIQKLFSYTCSICGYSRFSEKEKKENDKRQKACLPEWTSYTSQETSLKRRR
ncbi:MAG: hypothetical protein AAB521_01320 [Patescibacteria group bacterium]